MKEGPEINIIDWKAIYVTHICEIFVSVKCLWENKIAKEGQPLLQ